MTALWQAHHRVILVYEPENADKLTSPCGQYHYLPCEKQCGTGVWVDLLVVSTLCRTCGVAVRQPAITDEYEV